jgi:hypothetical protein
LAVVATCPVAEPSGLYRVAVMPPSGARPGSVTVPETVAGVTGTVNVHGDASASESAVRVNSRSLRCARVLNAVRTLPGPIGGCAGSLVLNVSAGRRISTRSGVPKLPCSAEIDADPTPGIDQPKRVPVKADGGGPIEG